MQYDIEGPIIGTWSNIYRFHTYSHAHIWSKEEGHIHRQWLVLGCGWHVCLMAQWSTDMYREVNREVHMVLLV